MVVDAFEVDYKVVVALAIACAPDQGTLRRLLAIELAHVNGSLVLDDDSVSMRRTGQEQ